MFCFLFVSIDIGIIIQITERLASRRGDNLMNYKTAQRRSEVPLTRALRERVLRLLSFFRMENRAFRYYESEPFTEMKPRGS